MCLNVNELAQMLDAAITERCRAMIRAQSSKKIYSLSSEKNAQAMLNHLNDSMQTRGIMVQSVIITNVRLPEDVARSMQEKTIFQYKNTLERKTVSFDLRI
mmetsp:Transcript_10611/g.7933  ORF Transcript_10611/g.7933 Transcript_10611/m.7933 type:complete len:101 (-) Transcript_10611:582-884(-)